MKGPLDSLPDFNPGNPASKKTKNVELVDSSGDVTTHSFCSHMDEETRRGREIIQAIRYHCIVLLPGK